MLIFFLKRLSKLKKICFEISYFKCNYLFIYLLYNNNKYYFSNIKYFDIFSLVFNFVRSKLSKIIRTTAWHKYVIRFGLGQIGLKFYLVNFSHSI